MKTSRFLCCLALAAGIAGTARATPDSFIRINVSVKLVVHPTTGNPPATFNDAILRDSFTLMNRWLANTWRGYRVQLVDLDSQQNFKRIGNPSQPLGPVWWYSVDLKNDGGLNHSFENAAKNNAEFAWNSNALNLYINNGDWSAAQFPSSGYGLVISGYGLVANNDSPEFYQTNNYKIAANLLHEVGHFFELYHTFGGGGDDGILDTAPDPQSANPRNETAVRNSIAQHNWGVNYSSLTTSQKTMTDNTANNAMAYYQLFYDDPAQSKVLTDAERFGPSRFLFTELQMDKWADNANLARFSTVSGTMRFVDASVASTGFGASTSPIKLLSTAITSASASGNDILMLRPGSYTAATLTKPMTIRATRTGPITIAKP